jgi:hypothetical protein
MADNIQLPNSQIITASDDVGGIQFQRIKVALGADGQHDGDVSIDNPLPVKLDAVSLAALENINVTVENPSNSGLTDAQLRANPVVVDVVNQSGLTDQQLRASPFYVNINSIASQPLPSGATTELTLQSLKGVVESLKTAIDNLNAKITEVNTANISGQVDISPASLTALENTTVTVSNPTPQGLTDTQLRASSIPVNDDNTTTAIYELYTLSNVMKDMSDGILYMQSAILEKMARLDRFDRMTVQVSDNSGNELNSAYYGVSSNLVGEASGGRSYSRIHEPWHFSNIGANHLYNQLTISA